MINEAVRHIIEEELTEGEELLWADEPQVRILDYQMIFVIVLGVLFIFISIFMIINELNKPDGLWGLILFYVFFAALVWGLIKQAVTKLMRDNFQFYGITTERGLIIERYRSKKYKWLHFERKNELSKDDFSQMKKSIDGDIGSLHFHGLLKESGVVLYELFTWKPAMSAFRNIKKPSEVENLIRKTFLKKD